MIRRLVVLLCLLTAAAVASLPEGVAAHETTRSYATVEREGRDVTARLRVAFRDIEVVAWMDEDLDGRITWGEARRRLDAVDAYVRAGFSLRAGGACELTRTEAAPSTSGDVAYLDLQFEGRCPSGEAPLTARSRLFTEVDPDHRMFLQASVGGGTTSGLLNAAEPRLEIDGETGGVTSLFVNYLQSGVEHLLSGTDHVVFLLALMLPAVCAGVSGRKAAFGVVTAVTGFTIAHAITLSAAMTELLRPPSTVIEVLIALSIVITAVDNVRPFIPAPRAAVAGFFGLVHGFGFAGALGALELTAGDLAVALLGFNLGIEAAQVAIVLATMPVLFMLGAGRRLLWVGSAAAGGVGLWWLWVRLTPLFLGG